MEVTEQKKLSTTATSVFHYISYLQYPLLLVAMYYVYRPYIFKTDTVWQDLNTGLIFLGIAISFSSLQDTQKTQNKFSKRIWESPIKGKVALVIMTFMTFSFIVYGMFGLYFSRSEIVYELSVGIIVLGIGFVGLLKVAIEMFENHRIDYRNELTD
ncbi:MAG: hypothetical protein AAF992_05280 [Bacteroidota bacterium]